jgi:hypothetical protein
MVHMHRKRPRRQAEVTHDVSLDIGRRQLWPSANDHNDHSALERDLIRLDLHRARDDARLRPRPSGLFGAISRKGGTERGRCEERRSGGGRSGGGRGREILRGGPPAAQGESGRGRCLSFFVSAEVKSSRYLCSQVWCLLHCTTDLFFKI